MKDILYLPDVNVVVVPTLLTVESAGTQSLYHVDPHMKEHNLVELNIEVLFLFIGEIHYVAYIHMSCKCLRTRHLKRECHSMIPDMGVKFGLSL
jgi:hypothetical protein